MILALALAWTLFVLYCAVRLWPKASHTHEWKRVPPVVTTVGDPYAREKAHQTYNAECAECGEHAWLHWPEPRYGRSA